jgi:3-methyladenine DNA glycosylase AlkD
MDILNRLEALSEPGYRAFNERLIPTKNRIIGVRAPHIEKLARELLSGDWRTFLDEAPDDALEILFLKCAAIGGGQMPLSERFERIRSFLPKVDNWAVCDALMGRLHPAPDEQAAYFDFVEPYFNDDREFFARFAAVMMIRFSDPDWIGRALQGLARVRQQGYYARMGVAWALSHLYVDFPAEVEELLRREALDAWTHNKAIQKIAESFRVDEGAKRALRALKRRSR